MQIKAIILGVLASASIAHANADKFEQDRAAILQFEGAFKVDFQFRESLAVKKDYELKEQYTANAHELVELVEDNGDSITFQHLLVVQMKDKEPKVIKHWSQTWKYQDTEILDYTAKNQWESRSITAAKAKGTWSQFVTQVDDSPRYEAYGTWQHFEGSSIWVSQEGGARPLPRRESTKRKDYDIVLCTNRNVVTANGWHHEQHNAKCVRRDGKPGAIIAHEIGLNSYVRDNEYDFTVARDYWSKYAKYWDTVRKEWNQLYAENSMIKLAKYHDDTSLRDMTYEMVEIAEEEGKDKLVGFKAAASKFINQQ
ncbi:DUF6607 family protein [Rubritalea marina]|uniref:DUF6607 family protein n=1 Tax=Rubritalea marina TaxID=361055 RepID=UPI00036DE0E9|nr:DUF6607 family protein [Rubritalea marina]